MYIAYLGDDQTVGEEIEYKAAIDTGAAQGSPDANRILEQIALYGGAQPSQQAQAALAQMKSSQTTKMLLLGGLALAGIVLVMKMRR